MNKKHNWHHEEYEITTDVARFDMDAIHTFLVRAYWSEDIPKATLLRSIENSLCFGLFENQAQQKNQIGFARIVTDKTTFAYLCDVYVLEAHRGKGLAKWLMQCVMEHSDLQGLRRFMLVTRDSHFLYQPFGFKLAAHPERVMEIARPGIYKKQ
jgi:GNAT superfamily N-acetyltransferase